MLFRSNDTATTEIYTVRNTLSLHNALPILRLLDEDPDPEVRVEAAGAAVQVFQALHECDDEQEAGRVADRATPHLTDPVADVRAQAMTLALLHQPSDAVLDQLVRELAAPTASWRFVDLVQFIGPVSANALVRRPARCGHGV